MKGLDIMNSNFLLVTGILLAFLSLYFIDVKQMKGMLCRWSLSRSSLISILNIVKVALNVNADALSWCH